MKIMYVSANAELGGAEKILEILLKYHDREKFPSQVYFLNDGPLVKKWQDMGIRVHVTSQRFRFREIFRLLRAQKEFRDVLKQEKIDLVHSTMSYGHLFAGPVALSAGISEVWFQHGPVGETWDFWAARIPTRHIFYNSQFTANAQKKHGKAQGSVVYGPVEIPKDDQREVQRQAFRSQWNFTTQDFVCVHVARMDRGKGQQEFVRAIEAAHKLNPQVRGLLVGGAALGQNDFVQELKQWVKDNQLQKIIQFTGFMSPVDGAFYGGDLFVHTSTGPEPLGLTILEAMARHCPVIVSPFGGTMEIVTDQVSGILVDPKNCQKLSERILQLAAEPALRDKLAERAFFEVQKYEAAQWVFGIEEIYRQRIGLNG